MDIKAVYPNLRNFAPDFPTLVGRNRAENRPMESIGERIIFGAITE